MGFDAKVVFFVGPDVDVEVEVCLVLTFVGRAVKVILLGRVDGMVAVGVVVEGALELDARLDLLGALFTLVVVVAIVGLNGLVMAARVAGEAMPALLGDSLPRLRFLMF